MKSMMTAGIAKLSALPAMAQGYDFVEARTHDGRKFRMLTVIDEASRECLALAFARQLRHEDVLASLAESFIDRGAPAHIRSDNVLCREAAALTRGDLGSHPEGPAQARVAVLGQFGAAAERTRLAGREIEVAELQELAMMVEAPQITGLGQDGQCVDRTNARNVAPQLVVGDIYAARRAFGRAPPTR